MRKEHGFTMAEVMVTTAVAALVMTSAATASLPTIARERLRSATYELQSTLQVSRMEAIARNRPTRFVMDQESRTAESWDTKGTVSTNDDVLLRRISLPSSVSVARPDYQDAMTMGEEKSASVAEVTFASDGSAPGSTGEITLYGGGQYRKLDLQAAGGVSVDKWTKDHWENVDSLEEQKLEELWDDAREGYEDDWVDKLDREDTTEPPKDDDGFIDPNDDNYQPDPNDTGDDGLTWPDDPDVTDPPSA